MTRGIDAPQRVQCGACKRGWPELATVVIEKFGMVQVCKDPTACRIHGEKLGIWGSTAPTVAA